MNDSTILRGENFHGLGVAFDVDGLSERYNGRPASEAVACDIIGHESAVISWHDTHADDDTKRVRRYKLADILTLPPGEKTPVVMRR